MFSLCEIWARINNITLSILLDVTAIATELEYDKHR